MGVPRVGISPKSQYALSRSPWGQVSLEVRDGYGVTGSLERDAMEKLAALLLPNP